MALDYFLTVHHPSRRLEPEEVGRALAAGFRLQQNSSSGLLQGEGFSVSVFPSERERSGTREHSGLCVAFRVGKAHAQTPGIEGMLQVVSKLLRVCGGEACLTFQFETTLLIATGGRVIFTEEDPGFWSPSRKALFAHSGFSAGPEPFAG